MKNYILPIALLAVFSLGACSSTAEEAAEAVITRVRPIFMSTLTSLAGLRCRSPWRTPSLHIYVSLCRPVSLLAHLENSNDGVEG
jgi:hypothetical protein